MKHIICCLLAIGLGFSSCYREPVVLEFDDTYDVKKPEKGERDKLPPVDVYHNYVYAAEDRVDLEILRDLNEDKTVRDLMMPASLILTIKRSLVQEEALPVKVELMTPENAPEIYPTVVKGLTTLLPAGVYSFSSEAAVIASGEKSIDVEIALNKEEMKNLDPSHPYVLPIIYTVDKEKAVVRGYYLCTVTFRDKSQIPVGNNVVLNPSGDLSGGVLIEREALTCSSNYEAERASTRLTDGRTDDSWYVRYQSGAYLDIRFNMANVKAVVLNVPGRYKQFKSVTVEVSDDGGNTWIDQGTVQIDRYYSTTFLEFRQPVVINAIRLKEFVPIYVDYGEQYYYADITEVRVLSGR